METLRWAAALGMKYVWADWTSKDFDTFCHQTNSHVAATGKYDVKVAVHNHPGATVETQQQLETFSKN